MSMNTQEHRYTAASPEAKSEFDRIGEILRKTGKPFGVSGAYSEQFVKDWLGRGANWLCMNFDFNYIVNGGKAVLKGTHETLDALGPVSYTHLDVYKRQISNRPAFPSLLAPVNAPLT